MSRQSLRRARAVSRRGDARRHQPQMQSNHHDARVSHDRVAIAGNIARGRILHQIGRLCTQLPSRREHRHLRPEAAHADVLLRNYVEKPTRIQGQNSLDRAVILHSRYRVRLVVIHVARSDDQHGIVPRCNDVGEGPAELFQNFELSCSESDGHELELRLTQQKERKLDVGSTPASSASMGTSPSGVCHAPSLMMASARPIPVWLGHITMQRFGTSTRAKTAPATCPEYTYPACGAMHPKARSGAWFVELVCAR